MRFSRSSVLVGAARKTVARLLLPHVSQVFARLFDGKVGDQCAINSDFGRPAPQISPVPCAGLD